MADELKVGAVIDLSQWLPGVNTLSSSFIASTGSINGAMQTVATVSRASLDDVVRSIAQLQTSVEAMATKVVASMAKMSNGVRHHSEEAGFSLKELMRKFGEVAEVAELSAEGTVSAFGPLGALFGAGFLVHMTEGLKEAAIEVSRMSALTGVSVQRIVEFRGAMESLGAPTTNMQRILLHLSEQIVQANQGSKEARLGFQQLGVGQDFLKQKGIDAVDVLMKMSDHLHETKGNMYDAAGAAHILGARMGGDLAGALTVGSEKLKELMKDHEGVGKAMEANANSALALQAAEVELSAKIQEAMLPLLGFEANFITTTTLLWTALRSDIWEGLLALNIAVNALVEGFVTLAAVMYDIVSFDWQGAKATGVDYFHRLGQAADELREKVKKDDEEIQEAFNAIVRPPVLPPRGTGEGNLAQLQAEGAAEAKKKINDAYIDYYVHGLKQMFEAHQINLDSEVEGEKAAVQAKLDVERKFAQERIAIIRATKGGPEADKDIAKVRADLEAAEIKTRSEINDIDAKYDVDRIAHANAVSRALAEASKSGMDMEAKNEEEQAKRLMSAKQISFDQEATMLKAASHKRINAAIDEQEELLRIAKLDPSKNQADIIKSQEKLNELRKQLANEDVRIDEEAAQKKIELAQRVMEEEMRFAKQSADLRREAAKFADDQALKNHQISLLHWGRAEMDALNAWYQTQHQVLDRALADAEKHFGQESLEYKKLKDEESALDLRYAQEKARIQQQESAKFHQSMDVIGSSFQSAFGKMLTTHTSFAKVMQNFWNEMVQGWARMGLEILAGWVQDLARLLIETLIKVTAIKAVMALLGIKTDTPQKKAASNVAGATSRIQADAGQAAADVFLQAIEKVPFPANLAAAPAAASLVIAQMQGFEALAVAGSAGAMGTAAEGAVLDHDMLIQAHAKEMILPPHISTGLQTAIGNGAIGGGAGGFGAGSGGGRTTHNHWNITLNGADGNLKSMLDEELVPRIQHAMRTGALG